MWILQSQKCVLKMCFAGFDVLVDDAKGEEILFFKSLFVSRLEVITLMVLTLIMAKLQGWGRHSTDIQESSIKNCCKI